MAVSRFVEVSDKEISEIKTNSDQKTQKNLCKNTKTIIRLRLSSLGPVYEFVCDSFRTGNLNCFRVK
jgi:hypothetical protein